MDVGHGRIETRVCRQIKVDETWLPSSSRWPKLNSIIEIQATRDIDDAITTEKRYYISSLQIDAKKAESVVRQHWAIENSLHWVLDVTYREEESRIRRGNGAEVISTLRRLTLNLLKQNTSCKASMRRKRKIAALDDDLRSNLICPGN